MDKPSTRWAVAADLLALLALLALAAFLGGWGGAPFYHPDTLIEKALRTMAQSGDPKFFNYPALLLYLDGFLYQAVLPALGAPATQPLVDFYVGAVRAGSALERGLFVPGQWVTLSFSLLGVAATYAAASRLLRSRAAALAAGLILCTSPLWAGDAHYITVDTPLASLGMATVALTLWWSGPARPLRLWQLLLLGTLAGLTASAKYNGALVLLSIGAAALLSYSDRWQWLKHMLVVGAASLTAFWATNPCILLGSPQFYKDFAYEMEHARVGHPGFTTESGALFHLQFNLPQALGWAVLALAVLGLLWLLLPRRASWAQRAGLLAYPLAAFALIGASHLAFQRYALPLLPFLAILAAAGLYGPAAEAQRRLRWPGWAAVGLAAAALLAAVLAPNLRSVLQSDWLLTQTDTRADFTRMLKATGLDRSGGPGFAGMYTDLYFGYRFKGDQNALNRAVLLVFDSFSHDRWLYDAKTRLNAYRQPLDSGFVVIELSPYTRPKAEVTLSVQSIYSPYLPDLDARARPGPYIEIYLRDGSQAEALLAACAQIAAPCTRRPAAEGFYYQQVMK